MENGKTSFFVQCIILILQVDPVNYSMLLSGNQSIKNVLDLCIEKLKKKNRILKITNEFNVSKDSGKD